MKRDLFKSSINFKEMTCGSHELDDVGVNEDITPFYTRRSYIVEKRKNEAKKSPAKKIT